MMTLETMMTMPWWRASRTRPRETILIFNVQICIKDILKQFICKNIIFRLWWMTSCLPPSQYFFYSQVNGNHHQQETTLEQRPPLRKSHRDFIDNSLFWTRSSSHRCRDSKLKGTLYGSLDDLVVSIDEEDIPLFSNSWYFHLKLITPHTISWRKQWQTHHYTKHKRTLKIMHCGRNL